MAVINFGERLAGLRRAQGLSQTALAEKAGLTRDAIASLEQGRRHPAWATVLQLCGALGVACTAFAPEAAQAGEAPRAAGMGSAARGPAGSGGRAPQRAAGRATAPKKGRRK